jgi:hypothetical protein
VNIERNQLLLIVNTTRNVTYYNFADSATTLQAFTKPHTGANSATITLNSSVVSASSTHSDSDGLVIYYDDKSQESNELPYIKVNVNVINAATDALVSDVYLRRIGEYEYASIRYQGNEDEAYLRVILETPNDSSQKVWKLYSTGSLADIQGMVASRIPQNAGSNNGDALPPKSGWTLATGITGTLQISYSQPDDSPWELLGTRDWNANQSTWQISGLNAYSSIRLDNYGGGAATIDAWVYPPSGGDAFWRWDGQTENNTNKVFGFDTYNSHTSQVQNDQINIHILDADASDPNISKLYGKKIFASLGLTNQQLRESPVPISLPSNPATYVGKSDFTSTTAATIASANESRKALTIFSEGPGLLYVCAGSTCTTSSYQVRLASGEYWECPTGQLALIHTAVFGSTGTARVVSIN